MATDTTQAGLAFSLSANGLQTILKGFLQGISALPLANITLDKLDADITNSYGTYTVDSVTLSSGSVAFKDISVQSITQTDGLFHVTCNLAFTGTYGEWTEKGSVETSGGTHGTPHVDSYGETFKTWNFDVEGMVMTYDVAVSASPYDVARPNDLYWAALISNAAQQDVKVEGVKAPKDSILNNKEFESCTSDRVTKNLSKVLKNTDFADAFASATNSRLQTLPDSGKLTDKVTFCFPPTGLDWPAGGGIQAAISGLVLYGDTKYAGTVPTISIPDVSSTADFTLVITPYEIEALLWSSEEAGVFSSTYNAQTQPSMDPNLFSTTHYKTTLPELYQFAPDCYFSILAGAAASSQNGVTTNVAIQTGWIVNSTILNGIGAPDDVQTALKPIDDLFFSDVSSLDHALQQQYLTPDQYTDWGAKIETAAATGVLICQATVSVALSMSLKGQVTVPFQADLNLTLLAGDFTISGTGICTRLCFDFAAAGQTLSNVTTTAGLTVDPSQYDVWYQQIFSLCVNDLVASFRPAGQTTASIPIPQMDVLQTKKVVIQVFADTATLSVSGDLALVSGS